MNYIKLGVSLFLLVFFVSCSKKPAAFFSGYKLHSFSFRPYIQPYYGGINALFNDGSFFIPVVDVSNLHLMKFDKNSNFLNEKIYPSGQKDYTDIFTANNRLLAVGYTSSNLSFFATMYDANGNVVWDSTYQFKYGFIESVCCCVGTDGTATLAIGCYTTDSTSPSAYFATIGSAGSLVDLKPQTGMPGYLKCLPMVVRAGNDGGFYCTGYYLCYNKASGLAPALGSQFLLKSDVAGATQWFKKWAAPADGATPVIPLDLVCSTGGSIATVAIINPYNSGQTYFRNYAGIGNKVGSIAACSYDSQNGVVTDSIVVDNNKDLFCQIIATPDGGYITSTTSNLDVNSTTHYPHILLTKTNDHFDKQWSRTYSFDYNDYVAFGFWQVNQGYQIGGIHTNIVSNQLNEGMFFLRTDLNGNLTDY